LSTGARLAVLRAIGDEVAESTKALRADAEAEFGQMRRKQGIKSLSVVLPGGAEVGTVAIKAGETVVRWDGPALVRYVEATAETELVDVVDTSVLADPALIEWILEHRPNAVRTEVRDAYRDRLKKRLTDDGELVDEATGELHKVATVERHEPTGAFSYRPHKTHREDVAEAWRRGDLAELGGMFALPRADQADGDQDASEVDQ
jgi:hypothetical protein